MAGPIRVVRRGDESARGLRVNGGEWVERFARFGFASRGVVYMIMGWIALRAALGSGEATGASGAIRSLLDEPLGRVLIGIIALGLAAYALWRAYAALANPEQDSTGKRLHHAGIAIVHGALAVTAARLALAQSVTTDGSGNQEAAGWTARAMELPVGRWLVVAAGAAFVGYGLYQVYRGVRSDLDDMLDLSTLEPDRRTLLRRVSRVGIGARGVVFVFIGVFVAKAALEYDPNEAKGFGGALDSLHESVGGWPFAAVALGLVAYGVYGLIRARYRVVRTA